MSKIHLVTRHPGAQEWLKGQNLPLEGEVVTLSHFSDKDLAGLNAGDGVVGILPVNLAGRVCEKGGRYFHLSLELPPEARGKELGVEEMNSYGARLEEYQVVARTT